LASKWFLTSQAQDELESVLRDSAERFSVQTALRLAGRLNEAFERIGQNPKLYRTRRIGDGSEYRSCTIKPFVICYGQVLDKVQIFAIVHGARDLKLLISSRLN
jgi:plasmid stabilization system protein ParE